jgi:hypothetical protein
MQKKVDCEVEVLNSKKNKNPGISHACHDNCVPSIVERRGVKKIRSRKQKKTFGNVATKKKKGKAAEWRAPKLESPKMNSGTVAIRKTRGTIKRNLCREKRRPVRK